MHLPGESFCQALCSIWRWKTCWSILGSFRNSRTLRPEPEKSPSGPCVVSIWWDYLGRRYNFKRRGLASSRRSLEACLSELNPVGPWWPSSTSLIALWFLLARMWVTSATGSSCHNNVLSQHRPWIGRAKDRGLECLILGAKSLISHPLTLFVSDIWASGKKFDQQVKSWFSPFISYITPLLLDFFLFLFSFS